MITAAEYDEARKNGINEKMLYNRIKTHKWELRRAITQRPGAVKQKENIFALYQVDEFLFMGNAEECTVYMGFSSIRTIEQYATKLVRERKEATGAVYAIRVEDIDDDVVS